MTAAAAKSISTFHFGHFYNRLGGVESKAPPIAGVHAPGIGLAYIYASQRPCEIVGLPGALGADAAVAWGRPGPVKSAAPRPGRGEGWVAQAVLKGAP